MSDKPDSDKMELLRKVRALADSGIGGEKVNAEALLERLMRKYEIEECDIVDGIVKDHQFTFGKKSNFSKRLIEQIVYSVVGNIDEDKGTYRYLFKNRNRICIRCTDSEFLEIATMYDFYNSCLSEDLELLYSAFVQSNMIYPPDDLIKKKQGTDDKKTLSDEDKKVLKLAYSLEAHHYRKRIAQKGDAND